MKVRFGTYSGNGLDNHSIPLDDITPDAIFIKTNAFIGSTQIWTRSLGDDVTNDDNTGFYSSGIKEVNTDEIVLGTDPRVNNAGDGYAYFCWQDQNVGDFRFFEYDGDGTDNRSIDLGITPDIAMIFSDGTALVWTCTAHPTQDDDPTRLKTQTFGSAALSNKIQKLNDCGIEVGLNAQTNIGGRHYYGIAIKEITDQLIVFSYIGTGAARNVTVGFQPEFVLLQRCTADANTPALMAGPEIGNPTNAIHARMDGFGGWGDDPNMINDFGATYFSVGGHQFVNRLDDLHVGFAARNNDEFADPEALEIAVATQVTVEVVQTFEVTPNPPTPENPCLSPEFVSISACPDLPAASRPPTTLRIGFASIPGCGTLPSASHPVAIPCR